MSVPSTRPGLSSLRIATPDLIQTPASATEGASTPGSAALLEGPKDGLEAPPERSPFAREVGRGAGFEGDRFGAFFRAGNLNLGAIFEALTRKELANDPSFKTLAPEVQTRLLDLSNGRTDGLSDTYQRLAGNPQFRALTPEAQIKAAELLAKPLSSADKANIESLVTSPVFAGLDESSKTNLLAGLSNTQEARDLLAAQIAGGVLTDASADKLGALSGLAATVAPVTTGFGKAVDDIVNASLRLSVNFRKVDADHDIRAGKPGEGSYYNPGKREIVIDGNTTNPKDIAAVLAHEIGHAIQTPFDPPKVGRETTRSEYVNEYVWKSVRGEAEACLENMIARDEILKNTGVDIGINGSRARDYERVYKLFSSGAITRDQAIDQIARIWGPNERVSIPPGKVYNDYYATFANAYYNEHARKLGPGQRPE